MTAERASTGMPGLDEVLDGLRLGDNVVLNVDHIEEYRLFVEPYVACAIAARRPVIYMRFGSHAPLLQPQEGLTIHEFDPKAGFESFAVRIRALITEAGRGAFYVFDSLSDLLSAWATDQMVGNFFWVTCPYLFELDTIAYFALIRDRHSLKTIARIRDTTQVLLDVLTDEGRIHVHPLKVWQRHSPTMFLPHLMDGEQFIPLADSYHATRLLSRFAPSTPDTARRHLDHWYRLFLQAEELAEAGNDSEQYRDMVRHLCRHMMGQDERMLALARETFSLDDLLAVKARMIGTGFIGGKAVGMLLARDILLSAPDFDWSEHLEPHDSFFVGSNVYYTYIVHNGFWPLYARQKTPEGYFEAAAELRAKMLEGSFPEDIRVGFQQMLEYYGQYPIIVRSSSLLEDGFGNAFAGKYDSFFCVNQGSPEQRLAQLEDAVRRIYASAMSEDALAYRRQRGLEHLDEQMALLVQRVSGTYRGHWYFPELAGVGVSYNTFVWDKDMDPRAGMLRLVLGLGTRAVDRVEGDYPRLVALDAPLKRPHKGLEDARRFLQRDVDLLDISSNAVETVSLLKLANSATDLPLDLFATRDEEITRRLEERGRKGQKAWLLTFDQLLSETPFCETMQRLLKTLEKAYDYPVDVEFTVNFSTGDRPRINVVQCRPLQTRGERQRVEFPQDLDDRDLLLRSEGNFMGGNASLPLKQIIWVDPQGYSRLPLSDKYEVARLVGRLNRRIRRAEEPTLLMGPGRWGSSTPALGVPISFAEINNMAALAEVAFSSEGLMPELSFGSHFFQDLVEADIFYLALFPEARGVFFNETWVQNQPNALEGMMPASSRFKSVVKIIRVDQGPLQLLADVVSQRLLCTLP
ncbi:PEP/pyruvate-binding domain-containing protein [Geoalkalibacter halelectricus]|uniref:Phosphoenolpyruvate synthase n=1 Tax=Geoalkalibacter halelectricus TaxID=2847045 RepID=A0ABY5ZQ95_9BACT|nr:PEP/pyruvate-binding domain-containing protein [Geoalkalibacter halelectricus]MDO3377374.1 PEP/pyruvate-binding domain-containing protein [Geoalkalibacter halelectricus]UWZ80861.1 PEP/pyruvate-binding domain-containing protein [Geoalkalibacter halelectricus]